MITTMVTNELGRAEDNNVIIGSVRPSHTKGDPLWIGVRGTYFNVTSFAKYHPGGDVIYEFHKQDATAQFVAYHPPLLLERLKLKVEGTYEYNEEKPGGSAMQGDWMKLNDKFEREGYYETPMAFIWSRVYIVVGFFIGMFLFLALYKSYGHVLAFLGGALCLAGVWQQSGFLTHDTMHNHLFHKRKQDQRLGFLFGTVIFGISSRWWRDEHNEHHLFTNTFVPGVGISDPQMQEPVWIQDAQLVPFFFQPVVKHMLRFQKYYFMPLCVFVGPQLLRFEALVNNRRMEEFVGVLIHFTWVAYLVRSFPTVLEGILFVVLANTGLGILTIQLLVSHYSKPFAVKEETKHAGSWAKRQVEAVMDITCPKYLDWFHGGLNLHSPHHLFPRMCRCHYRTVHKEIVTLCATHGVALDISPWWGAVKATLHHLGEVSARHQLLVLVNDHPQKKA